MLQRVLTVIVWGLVGASAVAFGLKMWPGSPASTAPVTVSSPPSGEMDQASRDRLFGAAPVAPTPDAVPTDSRFKLIGLAAPRSPGLQNSEGVALLTIDDGPPRAIRVGQWVDGETQLLAVTARTADLGRDGVVRAQLRLEALAPAATGSLPPTSGIAPPPPMPSPGLAANNVPVRHMPNVPMPAMPDPSNAVNFQGQDQGDEEGPRRRMPGQQPPPNQAR